MRFPLVIAPLVVLLFLIRSSSAQEQGIENLPRFDLGYMDFWWYDADKAEKLKSAGVLR